MLEKRIYKIIFDGGCSNVLRFDIRLEKWLDHWVKIFFLSFYKIHFKRVYEYVSDGKKQFNIYVKFRSIDFVGAVFFLTLRYWW